MGKRRKKNKKLQQSNEEKKEEVNKLNPKGEIVLGVFIHCEGCAKDVTNHLREFDGVEQILIDEKNHKVIVKGMKADPIKVTERLRKKSGKHVELISPIPPKDDIKKEEKKEEPQVIEVELKIYLHCEGCAKDVKHCIHKMEGVQTVEPDMKTSIVKVKGVFDPNKLVEFVTKRSGRHVSIVKQTTQKKEDKPRERHFVYANYPREIVYAPQLFSDENPNSCVIV